MKVSVRALVCVVAFACVGSFAQDTVIFDSKLFVDGVEFIVKGVNYSPSPIGQSSNTGFCSYKMSAYAEWKSPCSDSDYFDGSPWLSTDPSVQGFKPLWDRDFPLIKATGTNTIRLYNANPTTWGASQVYKNIIPSPTGKDHTQFMALAAQYGLKVIFPLILDNGLFDSQPESIMKRYFRWQIDEVGNFSSLLMWQLGNEQDWTWHYERVSDVPTYTKFNDYVDYIKRYTYSKWNRRVPVSFSLQGTIQWFDFLMSHTNVDIFGTNVFEGGANPLQDQYTHIATLIVQQGTQNFQGMDEAKCAYSKAYLMTEFGWTWASGHSNQYPPGEINRYWSSLVTNIDAGLIGGVYFEFTDEPALGKDQGVYTPVVAYRGSNSSTGSNQLVADNLVAKNPQYNDLISGTWNNKAYNFVTDVYSLLGRPQARLATTTDRCLPKYKACPGNTLPVCNGNGRCDRNAGVCTCGTGWSGADCSIPVCPGTTACNGRGACSTFVSPPECFCDPGYFGLACESTPSFGSCPGSCTNGNGVCNNVTWACACWPGWTGLDCSVTDLRGLGSRTASVAATSSASTSATLGVITSSSSVTSTGRVTSTVSVSASLTVSASVSASASASTTNVASTTGTVLASTSIASVSSTGSTSATASKLSVSSTGSVAAATSNAASTSATVAATSTASLSTSGTSVAATSTGSVSSSATVAASTSTVSAATLAASTSSSASVSATSTGSTSATLSASSSASTSGTLSKSTTTAAVTTSSSASSSNQVVTSSVSLAGSTATASYSSTSTVGEATSSTTLAESSSSSLSSSLSSSAVATSTSSTAAASSSETQASSTSSSSSAVASVVATTSSSSSSVTTTTNKASSSEAALSSSSTTSLATRATSSTSSTGVVTTTTLGTVTTTGHRNVTSITLSSVSTGVSTPAPLKKWDVTITLVVPGDYHCLVAEDLSVVLRQIFKMFPTEVDIFPNAKNQTWFSANATFVVTNSTVFTNATKVLMASPYIQNLIPNCGPNILSASVQMTAHTETSNIVSSSMRVSTTPVIFWATLLVNLVFLLRIGSF